MDKLILKQLRQHVRFVYFTPKPVQVKYSNELRNIQIKLRHGVNSTCALSAVWPVIVLAEHIIKMPPLA